jgi:hypothetical protein
MKLGSVQVLILSLAMTTPICTTTLHAQDAQTSANPEIDRCVKWMSATVSPAVTDGLKPIDFCSGIKSNTISAWDSTSCGDPAQPSKSPRYCASSGQLTEKEAWTAGFSGPSLDGRELLNPTPATSKDTQAPTAVFYSRTDTSIEDLRLPAGMYNLIPSHSSEGWTLTITPQDEATQPPKPLGTVPLKSAVVAAPPTDRLAISTKPWSDTCTGPSRDFTVRELHFVYGTNDLFVCVRPDQSPIHQQSAATQTPATPPAN